MTLVPASSQGWAGPGTTVSGWLPSTHVLCPLVGLEEVLGTCPAACVPSAVRVPVGLGAHLSGPWGAPAVRLPEFPFHGSLGGRDTRRWARPEAGVLGGAY